MTALCPSQTSVPLILCFSATFNRPPLASVQTH
uniref:Uncharacterized protein n=1 Tax=Anguilla anguilla TaxID=7936 RepID=A0A0E9Y107_ANGAN